MMSSRRAALLVGTTVILASAWAIALVFYLRGSLAASRVYYVEAIFPDALGIRRQARVYLAGVEVGEVTEVTLTSDFRARVRMALHREISIPEDTVAVVSSPGIAGVDKLIALIPGTSARQAAGGTVLKGLREPTLSDLAPAAQQTLQQLQQMLQTANRWLNDPQIEASLKQTLRNLEIASSQLITLSEQVRATVAQVERSVQTLAQDARQPIQASAKAVEDLRDLLAQSRQTAAAAEQTLQNINRLTTDDQMVTDLQATVRQMRDLSERLNRIAEDLGRYTSDEELRENLRRTVAEARYTLTEARQATTNINRFIDRLLQPRSTSLRPVDVSLDLFASLRESNFRTDLAAIFPYRDGRFFVVGVYDVTESNKIVAQYGSPLPKGVNLRYGLYASKPAIGLDWQINSNLQLRADLFNPNDLQADLRAKIRLAPDWNLWVGVDRLFDGNRPTLGVQIVR